MAYCRGRALPYRRSIGIVIVALCARSRNRSRLAALTAFALRTRSVAVGTIAMLAGITRTRHALAGLRGFGLGCCRTCRLWDGRLCRGCRGSSRSGTRRRSRGEAAGAAGFLAGTAGFLDSDALPCALEAKAFLSLRATGGSTVDDADFTNSPIASSLFKTVLLSTPSSLASSYACFRHSISPILGRAHTSATATDSRRACSFSSCNHVRDTSSFPGHDGTYPHALIIESSILKPGIERPRATAAESVGYSAVSRWSKPALRPSSWRVPRRIRCRSSIRSAWRGQT